MRGPDALLDLLGIRVPVLLAPMAGGPGTPALAAAVSSAGGLGVLGISGLDRETAAGWVTEARRLCGGGPIAVNAQVAPPVEPTCDEAVLHEVLRPFRRELGLPEEPPSPPPAGSPVALVEAALEAGATAVTTFGHPGPAVPAAAGAGVPLLAMVTTPAEAVEAREAGAAALIAQGDEAGGHRGVFRVEHGSRAMPTLSLVPAVVEAVGLDVPVIASGGIVDREGSDAALAVLGAGVSCGTVFLQADEAGVGEAYRDALRRAGPDASVVTDAVTGRPARWLRNRLVDALVEARLGTAGWPRQGALLADVRRAAAEQGRADLLPMLAGTRSAATGPRRPAAEIVAELTPVRRPAR